MDATSRQHRRSLEATLGVPFTDGNSVKVLRNGDQIFPAMLSAIKKARQSIDLVTYVYWSGGPADDFADALCDRAEAGVEIRLLVDAYGGKEMDDSVKRHLCECGVDLRFFRPFRRIDWTQADNRTHRKILICDREVGFTGGAGIAQEWAGDARNPKEWRDTHFEIRGPALDGLLAGFLVEWAETTGELPRAPEAIPERKSAGSAAIQSISAKAPLGMSPISLLQDKLVQMAQRELIVVTPYFAPDGNTTQLVSEALERGVSVKVMIPGPHIDKGYMRLAGAEAIERLSDEGADIRIYQKTMLHQKLYLVDGVLACVGSANFNQRSIGKDSEFVLNVIDEKVTSQLRADFETDLAFCEPATIEGLKSRSLRTRLRENLVRLFRFEL